MDNVKKDKKNADGMNSHVNDIFSDILNRFAAQGVGRPINIRLANKESYERKVNESLKNDSKGEEIITNNTDEL
jgi:hypothetical protein